MSDTNPVSKFISHAEAMEKFNLEQYFPLDVVSVSGVLLMDGDTHIQEDLDSWYEKELKDNSDYDGSLMLIINGNLKVDGIATGNKDFNAHLLVIGDLHCDILRSYDESTWITGNAYAKYLFDGNYNDGSIEINGILDAPYLLNSDHSSDVEPSERCILICYHGNDSFFQYDIDEDDFERAFIPEIYSGGDFSIDAFYRVAKSERSPFVEGFKIKRLTKHSD